MADTRVPVPKLFYTRIKRLNMEGSFDPTWRISMCTSVSNRMRQFSQVFDRNIDLLNQHPNAEWVILNFNSRDNLDQFMMDQLKRAECRQIVYVRETSGDMFHMSRVKNITHKIATGQILVNLDADNYINDAIDLVKESFRPGGVDALHNWSGTQFDGTFGRLFIRREVFLKYGGYDESFFPMGYQDTDFIIRMLADSAKVGLRKCKQLGYAIENTKEQSIEHCRIKDLTWLQYNARNRATSHNRYHTGERIVNKTKPWGTGKLEFVTYPQSLGSSHEEIRPINPSM